MQIGRLVKNSVIAGVIIGLVAAATFVFLLFLPTIIFNWDYWFSGTKRPEPKYITVLPDCTAEEYRLDVPEGYVEDEQKTGKLIVLRTVYPEMVPYNKENRNLFYDTKGHALPSIIRIFLSRKVNPEKPRNLSGKYNLEDFKRDPSLISVALPETLKKKYPSMQHFIHKKQYPGDERNDEKYTYTQPDGRFVLVTCIFSNSCSARTNWDNGTLNVEYNFSRTMAPDHMAEIDLAVNKLLSSFHPRSRDEESALSTGNKTTQ